LKHNEEKNGMAVREKPEHASSFRGGAKQRGDRAQASYSEIRLLRDANCSLLAPLM